MWPLHRPPFAPGKQLLWDAIIDGIVLQVSTSCDSSGLLTSRFCDGSGVDSVDGMGDLVTWAREQAAVLLRVPLPRRWAHVQGVANRAGVAAPLFVDGDRELLSAAAVLHDVGYSPEVVDTGFHPLDGARALRNITDNGRLVALVAHHSCAYREAELRGLSVELTEWTDEESTLRDALWWADMTTSPDGEPVAFDERIKEIQDRYGPRDVVTFFIRQAEPELRGAVERTEARLRAAGISYE